MRPALRNVTPQETRHLGFTLAEVVISLGIVTMVFSGVLIAYTQAAKRAQWTGYSLAAQALAIQQIEQARAATWDPSQYPPTNQLQTLVFTVPATVTNNGSWFQYKGYTTNNLDLPTSGANYVRATNWVTITMMTPYYGGATYPKAPIQMVRVDTVWPFTWRNGTTYYTNTVCTYLAPDNSVLN